VLLTVYPPLPAALAAAMPVHLQAPVDQHCCSTGAAQHSIRQRRAAQGMPFSSLTHSVRLDYTSRRVTVAAITADTFCLLVCGRTRKEAVRQLAFIHIQRCFVMNHGQHCLPMHLPCLLRLLQVQEQQIARPEHANNRCKQGKSPHLTAVSDYLETPPI
jgi:hypothetical protein